MLTTCSMTASTLLNPIRLDGFKPTDEESIGMQLQKIAKEKDTKGEYRRVGEIHGFPILESHRKPALPAKTLLKTLGG